MSKSNNDASSNQHDKPGVHNLGTYLQDLRTQHNVTIEQLSKHLKIKIGNLRAIEDNRELPHIPLAYYRGYVKSYCMFFGVDPEPILQTVRSSSNAQRPPKPVYNNSQAFMFSQENRSIGGRRSRGSSQFSYKILVGLGIIALSGLVLFKMNATNKSNVSQTYISQATLGPSSSANKD